MQQTIKKADSARVRKAKGRRFVSLLPDFPALKPAALQPVLHNRTSRDQNSKSLDQTD
jgi:hypothetical protein